MFDSPSQRYPKKWWEMSLDFKLMFVYHGCMMALFLAGQNLTVRQEVTLTGFLFTVLCAISLRHRRTKNWHRPPLRARDVAGALFATAVIAFFLFSATPLFPPLDHRALPWYFAGLGIGGFAILQSLRVVEASEADFLSHCRAIDQYGREIEPTPKISEMRDGDPTWKRTTRGIYTVTFMLVWTLGVACFFLFGTAFRHGSPMPTATQAEPLTDHGKTVFVTHLGAC
jgi:amino acid transporter